MAPPKRILRSNAAKMNLKSHANVIHRRNVVALKGKNPPLHTENQFSTLQQNDMDMDADWNNGAIPRKPTSVPRNATVKPDMLKKQVVKPPPIKITDDRLNATNIKAFMNELEVSSFQSKQTSIGLKIDVEKQEDNAKLIDKLTVGGYAFFTHSGIQQKMFKVVLGGLPRINTEIIVDELKNFNITALSVTELTVNSTNTNRSLYLVQIASKDVSLNEIRKIRAIDHTVVNWKPFRPRNKGPTQCRRCAMMGHGAQNCHRKVACLICASSDHEAGNCQFKENTNEAFVFKCFNCSTKGYIDTKHRANDPECPCRADYIEIRNKINHRNTVRNSKFTQNANQFNFQQTNFPTLSRNFEFVAPSQSKNTSYAEQVKKTSSNDDLYCMDELCEILYSTVDELMSCTNKGQQLKVLFKLLSNAFK